MSVCTGCQAFTDLTMQASWSYDVLLVCCQCCSNCSSHPCLLTMSANRYTPYRFCLVISPEELLQNTSTATASFPLSWQGESGLFRDDVLCLFTPADGQSQRSQSSTFEETPAPDPNPYAPKPSNPKPINPNASNPRP